MKTKMGYEYRGLFRSVNDTDVVNQDLKPEPLYCLTSTSRRCWDDMIVDSPRGVLWLKILVCAMCITVQEVISKRQASVAVTFPFYPFVSYSFRSTWLNQLKTLKTSHWCPSLVKLRPKKYIAEDRGRFKSLSWEFDFRFFFHCFKHCFSAKITTDWLPWHTMLRLPSSFVAFMTLMSMGELGTIGIENFNNTVHRPISGCERQHHDIQREARWNPEQCAKWNSFSINRCTFRCNGQWCGRYTVRRHGGPESEDFHSGECDDNHSSEHSYNTGM